MATERQRRAARKNVKKAQAAWRQMSHRQKAIAQPQGRSRARAGTRGTGRYYRIQVRPKEDFVSFRYHDVGRPGHTLRLAGRRASGSWGDVAWLISKGDAHVQDDILVADRPEARKLLKIIGPAKRVRGDVFKGHPRRNVPERSKPTRAQSAARLRNIRRAQAARRKRKA